MHKEYKRFLLKQEISEILGDLRTKFSTSDIFFTKIKFCKEIKYERTDDICQKIVQSGARHIQTVTYKRISKKKYVHKKLHKQGNLLNLKIYQIKVGECTMYIEAYDKRLQGLCMLTVPDNCLRQMQAHTLQNSYIGKFIEEDVTDDPRYEQKYLALFGNPAKYPYNIYAIFKDLEQKRIHQPYEIIFKEMKSADAIRIYLYKSYLDLHKYMKKIQSSKTVQNVNETEQFRNEVQHIITIIKNYEEIFDEQQYRKILLHMMTLLSVTKTYMDLRLIAAKITKLNNKLNSTYLSEMLQNVQKKTLLETHKINNYFNSREFQIISSQFQRFIREKNNSYTNYESQIPFGYSVEIKISVKYGELLQTIKFLDGCNDEKSYEKLKNTFREFIYFMKIFTRHIDSDKYATLLKKAEETHRLLEKYTHQNRYLLIIKMLLSHMNQQEHNKELTYLHKKEKRLMQHKREFDQNIFRDLEKFQNITF